MTKLEHNCIDTIQVQYMKTCTIWVQGVNINRYKSMRFVLDGHLGSKRLMPQFHYSLYVPRLEVILGRWNRLQGHLISLEIWCFNHTTGGITCGYRLWAVRPCISTNM